MVNIDNITGVAIALSSGTTTLYYKIPDVYSAQTEVKVDRPTFIRASIPDSNMLITNWPQKGGHGYIIPITLGSDAVSSSEFRGKFKEALVLFEDLDVKSQVPLSCFLSFGDEFFTSLSAMDLFVVKPGLMAGQPVCYITPRISSPDVAFTASTSEAPLHLLVNVRDQTQGFEVSSQPLALPFVPAFVVSKSEVLLTSREVKKRLVVTGTRRQLENLLVRS